MTQQTVIPDSPLRILRKKSGLSATDFARTIGIDVATLYSTETGAREIGRAYQWALTDMGVDVDALLEKQHEWRQEQSAILRRQHSARIKNAADATGGHRE